MINLYKKIKNWLENREYHSLEKILTKMPEIDPSSSEKIKTYYEIKGIKSQRISNWIMIILTIIIIINSYQVYNLQKTSNFPIKPNLVPKIIDESYNHFFASWDLVKLEKLDENWTFRPKENRIEMYVRNNGQGKTGNVNFYLMDSNNLFRANSINNVNIDSLDPKPLDFNIKYKECHNGLGKEDYKINLKLLCDYKKLPTGIMKWYLKIDCNKCQNEKNPQCYSFNICVFNESQQEKWCKSQWNQEMGELIPLNKCPEITDF